MRLYLYLLVKHPVWNSRLWRCFGHDTLILSMSLENSIQDALEGKIVSFNICIHSCAAFRTDTRGPGLPWSICDRPDRKNSSNYYNCQLFLLCVWYALANVLTKTLYRLFLSSWDSYYNL